MRKLFGHLNTVNKHRFEVLKLCCKFGIPFQGLLHDLSKYSHIEFSESIKYYTDGKRSPNELAIKEKGISNAWEHHKRHNKHHFEYWYINCKDKNNIPNMPYKYALEMFCDRVAASKTYLGKSFTYASPYDYYIVRKDHYTMNDNMKKFFEELFFELKELGIKKIHKNRIKELYTKYIKNE